VNSTVKKKKKGRWGRRDNNAKKKKKKKKPPGKLEKKVLRNFLQSGFSARGTRKRGGK